MIEAPSYDRNTLPKPVRFTSYGTRISPQEVDDSFRYSLLILQWITPYTVAKEKAEKALLSLQDRKEAALEIARIKSKGTGDGQGWFRVAEALSWLQLQNTLSNLQH